jgi:DNA-binding transcriptional LysR family regulator
VELRQLELFLAVLECGSVTRAAEQVFLSPGAVSMQLHQLAAELRTELFIRSGRKFLPTQAAFRLADHARQVFRHVQQIEQEFEPDPAKDNRPLHFATGATALIYCLGRPLRSVRSKYPNAEIQVSVSITEAIVAGLLSRKYDLGLISLPYPDHGLKIIPLFEEEFLVVKPSRTRVHGGTIGVIPVTELEDVPFLLYPHTSNMRTSIDAFLKKCGLNARVIMEADDTEAIKGLVESGFGCSILPQLALKSHSRHFRTYRIAGHRAFRTQALAMPDVEYPRALTLAIASQLQSALAKVSR